MADYVKNEDAFCLTYGDGLCDLDIGKLVEFHEGHGAIGTVTAVKPLARFGALEIEGSKVNRFIEKPDSEGGLINGGFFVLSPKVLDLIDGDETILEQSALPALAQAGQLRAFQHDGFWQPMDTYRESMILNDLWDSGNAPWRTW